MGRGRRKTAPRSPSTSLRSTWFGTTCRRTAASRSSPTKEGCGDAGGGVLVVVGGLGGDEPPSVCSCGRGSCGDARGVSAAFGGAIFFVVYANACNHHYPSTRACEE